MKQTTYYRHLRRMLELAEKTTARTIEINTTTIFWIDNLCKIYVADYHVEWKNVPYTLLNKTAVAAYSKQGLLNRQSITPDHYSPEVFNQIPTFMEIWLAQFEMQPFSEYLGLKVLKRI